MADKRISQLVERVDIANNDVLPIVASGATTTNKVTISTIQDWMQSNLDVGVTSVGLVMPSAFSVSGSPVTTSGNITVSAAGTASQYIRGDGTLADFPEGGGGGSSVSYYLNGSVSQGTIGGVAYLEMNKVPVLGAGTDFNRNTNGYIASFVTDAGDPALLEIPGGNWNFETYLSASSGGGSPSFYIELYKISGATATLIASNSGSPELISLGTSINPYFSALAVPTTTLTLTDRLAIRIYVTHAGRTITLHTENSHLCQIITTFTTGLTALNGLTAQVQNFAVGTSGTDFAITSSGSIHTFNLPTASATNRGALSSADWTTFNNKQAAGNYVTTDTNQSITGFKSFVNGFSLASEGGTNQASTFTNTGSIHEGSAGSNIFGFNNSNNIFFGKGLSNGGVIQWTNAAVRYYTLPDADGTIALTSDLSGYVTLGTTQTITGAKTFDSTTSNFVVFNTSNASGGALSFRRNGANLGHIGNSGVLGVGILDDLEVRSGISRALHLKTDGGKLTLSAGGSVTLDGALNGTSAIFSQQVRINQEGQSLLIFPTTTNSARIQIQSSGGGNLVIGTESSAGGSLASGASAYASVFSSGSTRDLVLGTNSTARLTINGSTGAATFSSSVGIGVSPAAVSKLQVNVASDVNFSIRNAVDVSGAAVIQGITNSAGDNIPLEYRASKHCFMQGNVGIGTASPAEKLEVQNGYLSTYQDANINDAGYGIQFYTNGGGSKNSLASITLSQVGTARSGNLIFSTSNAGAPTERMRITSGGYLKASNTGSYFNPTGPYHELRQSISDNTIIFSNTHSSDPYGIFINFNSAPNNTSSVFLNCYDGNVGTKRFDVRSNGGIGNYQANNTNLSDERVKKDIEPLESYWDKFKDIEIVKFKYKDQTHDDFNIGVIAQQVEAVAPEFVDVDGWNTKPEFDEEGNEIVSEEEPLKSIYTADLYHASIKVLQEAMAKIEKLEIEIDSLKNQIK